MAAKWFYSRDGVKNGPLTSRELKALARSGEILATDLLWKQGMSDWRPASEAGRLFPGNDHESAVDGGDGGDDSVLHQQGDEPGTTAPLAATVTVPPPVQPRPGSRPPSQFRDWAIARGMPAWLLEPLPVASGVALLFLCLWAIVWLITLSSPETKQMVDEVKETVITEASEAVTRAADAAKRGLSGDSAQPSEKTSEKTEPASQPDPVKPAVAEKADF